MILLSYTLLLVGGAVLVQAVWGHSLTTHLLMLRQRRQRRQRPALIDTPMPLAALPLERVVAVSLIATALVLAAGLALQVSGWLLLILLALMVCVPIGLVAMLEARINQQLDLQIVDAATQIASAMQSGVPLLQALQRLTEVLPDPLAPWWRWLVEQIGAPILGTDGSTRYLALEQVAQNAAMQTPHRLFMHFLDHVAAASVLAQSDARDRMQAAADALHGSRMRMAEIRAKLTHARVSGTMVLSIGLGLGVFLAVSMPDQFQAAFSGPLGPGMVVLLSVLYGLPVAGILLLSRVPALDV